MSPVHWKLLGESIREIGVLILVFVPLDIWITPSPRANGPILPHWLEWAGYLSADHWRILLFAVGGLTVLHYGIKIEARASIEMEAQKGGD
jgi:hypothetical protein